MTLSEQLLATRQAKLDIAIEQAAPKGWKAGRTEANGVETVTSKPYPADEDPKHRELLEANGYDPERFRIVGPVRHSTWTAYLPEPYRKKSEKGEPVEDAFTFQAKASRFNVVERPEGAPSVDELVAVVNRQGLEGMPQRVVVGVDGKTWHGGLVPELPYFVAMGDLQISKVENPTEELISTIMDLLDRAAGPLAAHQAATGEKFHWVHIPWLGDCVEGMNSQGGRLRWRTTLTITEQVRILRRLMLYAIEVFAPLTEKLTTLSVPGNHDEANSRDMDTRMDDSWAIEAMNQVADALQYNTERFGHVECYVPGIDEQGVVMEVGNTVVGHIHGHTFRNGQHFKWWAGQAFGGQDYGRARLLLQGHQHHFQVDEDGGRKWVCVPALERESIWWKQKTGTGGSPGLVTFQLDNGALLNLSKLEPEKAR